MTQPVTRWAVEPTVHADRKNIFAFAGAVYRAQADALEIEALAKRRLADEYDAAQERGGVKAVGETVEQVLDEIDAKRSENLRIWNALSKTDPKYTKLVRETLDALVEDGEEPTRAAVRRAVHSRPKPLSPAGKQLQRLRQAWREACPAVRSHFLTEIGHQEQSA